MNCLVVGLMKFKLLLQLEMLCFIIIIIIIIIIISISISYICRIQVKVILAAELRPCWEWVNSEFSL